MGPICLLLSVPGFHALRERIKTLLKYHDMYECLVELVFYYLRNCSEIIYIKCRSDLFNWLKLAVFV